MDLMGIYFFGVVICILLNSFVISVLLKKQAKVTYRDVFIISLCVSDLLKAASGYSLEVNWSIGHRLCTRKDHIISNKECEIIGFSITFLGLVSFSHFAGVAFQRCANLRFASKAFVRSLPLKSVWYVIIPSWLYGLFWSVLPLLGWSSYRPMNERLHLCGPNLDTNNKAAEASVKSFLISLLIFGFVIPLFVILICSSFIYQSLRNMTTRGQIMEYLRTKRLAKQKHVKKECIMGGLMIGAFVIFWSPFAYSLCLISLRIPVSSDMLQVSSILGKSSSLLNPMLCLMMDEFRSCFKDRKMWSGLSKISRAVSSRYSNSYLYDMQRAPSLLIKRALNRMTFKQQATPVFKRTKSCDGPPPFAYSTTVVTSDSCSEDDWPPVTADCHFTRPINRRPSHFSSISHQQLLS